MSKIQSVKPLLSAAADEIMKDVVKIIAGYEVEMFQSKREISRQRKMLGAPKPEIKLNTITERLPVEADEDTKMSKIEGLQVLVKHFLSVAADRIVEAVEKMIADYEGEMHQSKRDISQQCKMLHVLLQPEIRLTRIPEEAQINSSACKEDFLTEQQQEWNSSQRQNNPESLQTERSHKDTVEEEPLLVPSPGFSEPENGDDDDWNATQDGDSDRSEEWSDSGQHRTQTAKTPLPKKKQKSCKVCGKSFHYEGSLLKHLKRHPKDECGLCGMHFTTEEDFKLHVETHKTVKVVVCDVCGKCFSRTSSLKEHMRSHTGERPFICEVCGKSFSCLKSMTIHLRTHTGEKRFRCEVCGKSFSQRINLTKHHMIHTGEKPFKCSECGKSFRLRIGMTHHFRMHTGERPYSCATCGKKFIRHSRLKEHMRTHVKQRITVTTPVFDDRDVVNAEMEDGKTLMTKEQPLRILCKVCGKDFHSKVALLNHLEAHPKGECGLCGRHFNTEGDFDLHMKTHLEKVCEVCGKCFTIPAFLERHMRIHTGEKPFQCSECGKSFRQRGDMTIHLRVHTGEKPYSCATCDKRFRTNSQLKQHMRGVKHFASATL